MYRYSWFSFRTCGALVSALLVLFFSASGLRAQSQKPVTTVYSLIPSGGVGASWGPRIAGVVAASLANQGGLTVKSPADDVAQSEYLSTAQKLGADYYISGYVASLGSSVNVVLQLVSVKSGTLIWTNTMQASSPDDIAPQVARLGQIILQHAGEAYAGIPTPRPAPTATPIPTLAAPAPTIATAQAGTSSVASQSSASEVKVKGRAIAMLDTPGVSAAYGDYVSTGIALELIKNGYYAQRFAGHSAPNLTIVGTLLCSDSGASVLIAPTVSVAEQAPGQYGWVQVNLSGAVYDCDDHRALPTIVASAGSYDQKTALTNALKAFAKQYRDPKGPPK
jgi:hypothetical protein